MICTACGKANIDNAAFCEHCGTRMQAQPAAIPVAAPPPPFPVPPAGVVPVQAAQTASSILDSMSTGEKVSGAGAVAAIIGFFLPWVSAAGLGASASGLDLAKEVGAAYLIPLLAIAAGALCYFSSKAAPGKKLMYAGYLVLIGALCGPANLLALLFVSQLQSVAGIGLWLLGLGFTAIAAGGLMTIRSFSSKVY